MDLEGTEIVIMHNGTEQFRTEVCEGVDTETLASMASAYC